MITIQENISLKEYTTFDIGGIARFFVEVTSVEELREALTHVRDNNMEHFILAGGTNVLFSDDGFDGIIIKMALREISYQEGIVECGTGTVLLDFLYACADKDLGGLQNLAGIPGTVGGAVRGNAGAFGSEISDCIESVRVFDVDTNREKVFRKEECEYAYRQSLFKKTPTYVILSAAFALQETSAKELYVHMKDILDKRNTKHIQDIRSAGSFFMNPEVDQHVQEIFKDDKGVKSKAGRVPAGWLLERVGLDQKRVGDIQAGEMHANYFINVGGGTSEQVLQLASLAKTRVRDEFGVQLTEEVTLVGF